MKKELHLSIPKPCHEKWSSFTKTTQGGFCGGCQKDVIDFTKWDEERIKSFFKTRTGNTCGRFRAEQLKVYSITQPRTGLRAWLPMLMAGILAILTSRPGMAQTKPAQATEQYQPEIKDIKLGEVKKISAIQINGVVKMIGDTTGLPGVNVLRKGTAEGTATDANGAFSITIKNPTAQDVLEFSFIGLTSIEYAVITSQPIQNVNIEMSWDVTQLGEVVHMGGIHVARWYSPRRWWWGIKGLFRKN